MFLMGYYDHEFCPLTTKMFNVWFILENMGLWVEVCICPTVKEIPSKQS